MLRDAVAEDCCSILWTHPSSTLDRTTHIAVCMLLYSIVHVAVCMRLLSLLQLINGIDGAIPCRMQYRTIYECNHTPGFARYAHAQEWGGDHSINMHAHSKQNKSIRSCKFISFSTELLSVCLLGMFKKIEDFLLQIGVPLTYTAFDYFIRSQYLDLSIKQNILTIAFAYLFCSSLKLLPSHILVAHGAHRCTHVLLNTVIHLIP